MDTIYFFILIRKLRIVITILIQLNLDSRYAIIERLSTLQILTKTWNGPHNQVSVTKDAGNQMISGGRTDINQNFQKIFLEKSEKNMDNVVREDLVKTRMRVIDVAISF